jgi:ATP/ADP translocase
LADAGRKGDTKSKSKQQRGDDSVASSTADRSDVVEDSSFKQRLLRGIKTILTSRLLMCIFTYNALSATTSVLLSFQRAELVANRTVEATSTERDTAFLANVNMASSVAVFALQASGLGAFVASSCGQYGTLVLMPMIRMFGVLMLAWWHVQGAGQAPNLTLFLLLDEFTKVMNFAVAKPVRESLWRGLSAEARYDAKPIVDTLANRWGGGSAAFLTSAIGHIMANTGVGSVAEDGTKTLFGFPPVLILCSIAAVWWAVVSVDLGGIRKRIDDELKKQQ